jgi:RHH-type proline utilization regulon transcriptional repressor/proline dehydrogenase/delta 1-pyrroline-5-carboxylate dehydrogenase
MLFSAPQPLPGPTGEQNLLRLHGRGVFATISPWHFPLAIFTGQVAAALAAGNTAIAKPAEQTSLVGYYATQLLHEAGIPADVLQFVPGDGATVGAGLTSDPRVAGVVFTGSTDTARVINRTLAKRESGPIAVLIAETGGQNSFIADSSALPEQLVKDALASAFTSAGQRCSAARALFVQEDIADKVIGMLAGAMAELKVGDPALHVIRWKSSELDAVVDAINATGFGLTLGVHSRIDETVERIVARARVGNVYVNRNQIGAVVGVQAFGGQVLCGTGPKAGGPHYVPRFATEKTVTVNTTAAGGNASLLTLGD